MKILYAIQGTGNGHISRARDIIPILQKKAETDILISGTESDVDLPYLVQYRCKGLSFVFGKKGGIDLLATYKKGNLKQLYQEIQQVPVDNYDLVINDFEPVTAWACKLRHKLCIGLSHQAAVIHKSSPKPGHTDLLGKAILKNYAPVTEEFGFHFVSTSENIFTPVIRSQIRNASITNQGHYTVYLPAYADKRIIARLTEIKDINWQVFSKHSQTPYTQDNVSIYPINNQDFITSIISCTGILCGAGFETPAEAMFLKKKLMVIPMKGQYEQQCNAAALKNMGIKVIKNLKRKQVLKIKEWTEDEKIVSVNYPDITEQIIDKILLRFQTGELTEQTITPGQTPVTFKKFRKSNLPKILDQLTN